MIGSFSRPQMRPISSTTSASRLTSPRRQCGTITSSPPGRLAHREAEALEDRALLGQLGRGAEQLPGRVLAQVHGRARRRPPAAGVDRRADRARAAQLGHQPAGDDLRLHRLLGLELLLEAPGRLGAQRQARRRALDVRADPGRGLHQHARGRLGHLRARAAHDPGDRRRPRGVLDQAHAGVEVAPRIIERRDRLAVARAADDQPAAGHQVGVERVHRLAGQAASRSS